MWYSFKILGNTFKQKVLYITECYHFSKAFLKMGDDGIE